MICGGRRRFPGVRVRQANPAGVLYPPARLQGRDFQLLKRIVAVRRDNLYHKFEQVERQSRIVSEKIRP